MTRLTTLLLLRFGAGSLFLLSVFFAVIALAESNSVTGKLNTGFVLFGLLVTVMMLGFSCIGWRMSRRFAMPVK